MSVKIASVVKVEVEAEGATNLLSTILTFVFDCDYGFSLYVVMIDNFISILNFRSVVAALIKVVLLWTA